MSEHIFSRRTNWICCCCSFLCTPTSKQSINCCWNPFLWSLFFQSRHKVFFHSSNVFYTTFCLCWFELLIQHEKEETKNIYTNQKPYFFFVRTTSIQCVLIALCEWTLLISGREKSRKSRKEFWWLIKLLVHQFMVRHLDRPVNTLRRPPKQKTLWLQTAD